MIKKVKIVRRKKDLIIERFYRPMTDFIFSFLIKTKITPNNITTLSIFFGLISGIFFAFGDWLHIILGAVLSQFSLICDLLDGDLARTRKLGSEYGMWYDMIATKLFKYFIFLGATIGVYRISKDPLILIVGVVAIFNITTISFISNFRSFFKFFKSHTELPEVKNFYIPFSFLTVIFLDIGAIFNKVDWVLWFFAIFGTLGWIKQLYSAYKLGSLNKS
ncbi:MAG: CDP-alcohol phosphatidyltransferase family protein [Nanoarchaeota archaeon]